MVMPKSSYEESRQKRIEENSKIMEKLNIKNLSQSLHKPKPSPMKKAKAKVPREPVEPVRRSTRVAVLPTPSYREGLDVKFCRRHLPRRDVFINLVDENGNKDEALYLHKKTGLSAGWRRFAIDHELDDGDAVVFQLIKPITLKVFIIRVNDKGDGSN